MTTPFLYLPDAISLAMLIYALTLLRRSSICHCREELYRLQQETLLCWADIAIAEDARVYREVSGRITAGIESLESTTPARLFFIGRACAKIPATVYQHLLPEWAAGTEPVLLGLEDRKVQQKLQRVLLESDICLGIFYLFGSLSGWAKATVLLCKVIARMPSHKKSHRIDWAFDAMERVFSREGRRALRLAVLCRLGT